jgi:hypothetical protein
MAKGYRGMIGQLICERGKRKSKYNGAREPKEIERGRLILYYAGLRGFYTESLKLSVRRW